VVKSYPLPGSTCGFNGTGDTDATTNFRTTFQVSNLSVAFIGLELPGYPLDPEDCAIREAQVGTSFGTTFWLRKDMHAVFVRHQDIGRQLEFSDDLSTVQLVSVAFIRLELPGALLDPAACAVRG
jgi:hypothetical protein